MEFEVDGMRCGHCERAVRAAVAGIAPLATVSIDRTEGLVRVNGGAAAEAVAAAIRAEGYAVRLRG